MRTKMPEKEKNQYGYRAIYRKIVLFYLDNNKCFHTFVSLTNLEFNL